MKLLSPHVKPVALSEVKPFAVSAAPIEGESLMGFVNRSLAQTPINRTVVGLSLAGIGTLRPDALPVTLTDDGQIKGLATLLNTTEAQIRGRLVTKMPRGDLVGGMDFYGLTIRDRLKEYRFRRVSPLALSRSDHYRQVWDLRCFAFDPETLEVLIDRCPECSRPLDWNRAYGVGKCNRCLDERGVPQVDLRDYAGVPVEVDDREGLLLAPSLASPSPQVRRETHERLPTPWRDLRDSDVFEAIISVASALSETSGQNVSGEQNVEMKILPEALARAGRMMLDGHQGLQDVLAHARAARTSAPAQRGKGVELGPFLAIKRQKYLSPEAIGIFERAIQDEFLARPPYMAMDWDDRLQDGRIDLRSIARENGLSPQRLSRLIHHGLVPHIVGGHRNTTFRVFAADVQPIIDEVSSSIDEVAVVDFLNVSIGCLDLLSNRGLLAAVSPAANMVAAPKRLYVRRSAVQILNRLESLASLRADGVTGVRVQDHLEGSSLNRGRFGAAMICVLNSSGHPYYSRTDGTWLSDVWIADTPGFDAAMAELCSEDERIDASTAARLMETNVPMVERFARAGMLVRRGEAGLSFRRTDVLDIASKYVLGREALDTTGMSDSRRLRSILAENGVQPAVRLLDRPDLIFDRAEFEDFLRMRDLTAHPQTKVPAYENSPA